MNQKKIQFAKSIIILPLLTSLANFSPIAFLKGEETSPFRVIPVALETKGVNAADVLRMERAAKIDTYFRERSMPLEGHGMNMVRAAEAHDIDWRLLPAIAVRESSGGKHMCGQNPFGWGSCKIKFESMDDAIETLARNLGGDNPNTAHYYSGDTRSKLHRYNGTVIPTYVAEVVDIMERIDGIDLAQSKEWSERIAA